MRSKLAVIRLGVLVVVLVAVGITLLVSGTDGLRDLLTNVGESRWGLVAFIAVYALAVVALLPGSLGTLTAGAIYGVAVGAFAALAGATIGATLAFIISRGIGRDGAQELLGERLSGVDEFIGRNDFSSILVLRLMPIVPFNLLNYAAGLTSVRLSRYVPASLLGMAPGTILAAALANEANDPTGSRFLILFALFLVATAGSVFMGKRMQKQEAH